jgi:ketosteroid isomerase-like protein
MLHLTCLTRSWQGEDSFVRRDFMEESRLMQDLLEQTYDAFNVRDIDAVLALLHPDVGWPNGWEGGRVQGHQEVRDYWTRQWAAIDPRVEPRSFTTEADGRIAVQVHAIVRDLDGKIISDGMVEHVYHIQDGLIRSMEIRK